MDSIMFMFTLTNDLIKEKYSLLRSAQCKCIFSVNHAQHLHIFIARSSGKVMFSQACVKNSVHRGWGVGCIPACNGQSSRQWAGGWCLPRGMSACVGECLSGGCLPGRQTPGLSLDTPRDDH